MNYHDLYQQDSEGMSKETYDRYPAGDDKRGKPKKDKQNKNAPFKKKPPTGGTPTKTMGKTTSGPDDRLSPPDAYKAHPDPLASK